MGCVMFGLARLGFREDAEVNPCFPATNNSAGWDGYSED